MSTPGQVSGIVPDARHPGTVRIEVAGRALLTVPAATVRERGVEVGTTLEPPLLDELCRAADAEAAFRAALVCLGRRPYSRHDLARRLVMRGHPPAAADHAVTRAVSAGLVDDEQYTRHYVQTRTARGRGPARIRRELALLGVAAPLADRILTEEAGDAQEPSVVLALARKRAGQLASLPRQDRFRRVVQFMARRGYTGREVRELIRQAL